MLGGAGRDVLYGTLGKDTLNGGNDAVKDVFIFETAAMAGNGANRDTIQQFRSGVDKLDFSRIDTPDDFAFSGMTAKANSVWYSKSGGNVIVSADVDGNKVADFQLLLQGVTSLTLNDFIL